MIYRPTEPELLAAMQSRLRARIAQHGRRPLPETVPAADEERRARSLRTCHRVSSYEPRRAEPPRDSGAYVPEMAARLEDDPNLTDGARRCARKIAEYTYRKNREGRTAEITVTYLMRALRKCRRSVQRYLRLLEREGYIRVDVVQARARACASGLSFTCRRCSFPVITAKNATKVNDARCDSRVTEEEILKIDHWRFRSKPGPCVAAKAYFDLF